MGRKTEAEDDVDVLSGRRVGGWSELTVASMARGWGQVRCTGRDANAGSEKLSTAPSQIDSDRGPGPADGLLLDARWCDRSGQRTTSRAARGDGHEKASDRRPESDAGPLAPAVVVARSSHAAPAQLSPSSPVSRRGSPPLRVASQRHASFVCVST